MDIKLGKYVLWFGRARNNPNRKTEQTYTNIFPFISVTKVKTRLPKRNATRLRYFSETPVVRQVINMVKDGVMKLDWKVVPIDETVPDLYAKEIEAVKNIITHPNNEDDYKSFWGAVLEDSLVGDCMCFEKARAGTPERPLFLFPVDGLTVDLMVNDKTNRYAQSVDGQVRYFTSDDIAYVKRQNRTNTPFGLSPLEVSWGHINALSNTFEYAAETASNAVPKYILNIGKDLASKIDEFKTYFTNECMGEANIPIVATDALDSKQIAPVSEEALFMKWQTYVATFIAHEFGVPAQFIGLEKSSDRATWADKYEQFLENAIKPYAELIEKAINIHVIQYLGWQDKVKFQFVWEDSLDQKERKASMIVKQWSLDLLTANEARVSLGLNPLEEFGDDRISIYKGKVNQEYGINGYNGVGNDRYKDKVTDNKLDSNDE